MKSFQDEVLKQIKEIYNDDLKQNYSVLEERMKQLELQMDEIENRDISYKP